MAKANRLWVLVFGGILATVSEINLVGCNVFEPFAAKRTNDLDYRGLIIRGTDALNNKDFASAVADYSLAQQKNPAGSEGYMFHAQAIVALYHIDYNELKGEFDKKRSDTATGVPFVNANTKVENIDSIYYPIVAAVSDCEHIIRHKSDTIFLDSLNRQYLLPPDGDTASDGTVSPGVARLDLGLLEAVKGMLGSLDLDHNGHIDDSCGYHPTLSDSARNALCHIGSSTGVLAEKENLESFILLTSSIHINNLNGDGVKARYVSTNPNDINAFITAMQQPIAGASYNLDSVDHSLQTHQEKALTSEIQGVVDNVKDLSNFLGYMRYNDGIDNDFDRQWVATPTSMHWHNYDRDNGLNGPKDHGIRYDYDDTADFLQCPPGSWNIGHPVHRLLRPNLYVTFNELGVHYPSLRADTSKNSREALMRKKCHDMVAAFTPSAWVSANTAALNVVCDSVAPVLRANVTPPTRSDWISGTAGVDEEMIDDYDNDYDGLKDEDGRNLAGYDDDDDAPLDQGMIDSVRAGHPLTPMQWHDVAGHANQCIDIDTTVAMATYAQKVLGGNPDTTQQRLFQRAFCMGTLENRLYLAKVGGPKKPDGKQDSLDKYYSEYIAEDYASQNCLQDFDKLNLDYRNAMGLAANTDPIVQLACHYKHIWTASRPPNSEWTGGIYGIDEEKLDGVDNDGDGWIDEDLDVGK